MKCPLREVPKFDEEGEAHFEQADCLKEECAWWAHGNERCSIFEISCDLWTIGELLEEIKDKMHPRKPTGS